MNGPTECPPVPAAHKSVAAASEEFYAAQLRLKNEFLIKQKCINSQLKDELGKAEAKLDKADIRHSEDFIVSANRIYDTLILAYDKAFEKHDDALKVAKDQCRDGLDEAKTKYIKIAKNKHDSKDPNEGG